MKSKFARFGGAAMAATLLVLTACNASDNKSATAPTAKNWTEFRDQFLAGYFPLNPNFAVYQGKHEFDGQLPDWSPAGLEKQAAFLEKAIADAKAFDGKMTDAEKFERDYLVSLLKLTDGNVADAARIADRNRTELYRLLQKYDLTPAMFRQGEGEV